MGEKTEDGFMGEKAVRGIRGAISVKGNVRNEIFDATKKLLVAMVEANDINTEDISSVFFTTTPDLNADFPATAARELGWNLVPLLCAREIDVPGSMERLVRVLMHVNTSKSQAEIKHQFLDEAASLRVDMVSN